MVRIQVRELQLIGEKDIDALKALGTDFEWSPFKIYQTEYSFYNVPYDFMLSLYWNSASKLVARMLD